jgi:hypothetical protein
MREGFVVGDVRMAAVIFGERIGMHTLRCRRVEEDAVVVNLAKARGE